MSIAQKVAGFSLGQADILRRAMGKKKKSELDKQFEGFSAGMHDQRLLRRRRQGALGHPAAVLRLRLQQGALRRLRRRLVLDRLPQGALPGRVHGRAADQRRRLQGQDRRSTSTSAAAWASRCCRRTSTSRSASSPPSATTSASASAPCATSASTSSRPSAPPGRRRAEFTSFHDFLRKVPLHGREQAHGRVADQGRRVRLARRHPAGPHRDPRGCRRRRRSASSATRPTARSDFDFDGIFELDRRPLQVDARPPGVVEEGQARVRARDARPLRLRPPARRARAAAREARHAPRSPTCSPPSTPQDGETVTIAGLDHERAAPRRRRTRATSTA